jgi:hypothetical protein
MQTTSPFFWPLLAGAIIILMLGCGRRDDSASRVANVAEVQDIQYSLLRALTDIHGALQQPFDDANSKAIVLVFTMQDCPIANSYVPTLNQLVETYEPRGVRMLLVHVDSQLTEDEARKHAEEYQIKAPVVIDREHAWVDRAGAERSPEVAVFSPAGEMLYSGRIDDSYAGLGKRRTHVTVHDLRDALDAILAGHPVARPKTEVVGCMIPTLPLGE